VIRSLRTRLLLGLLLTLSLALSLVIGASWWGARRELASLFDAHLQQSAAIMLLWTQTEPRAGETLDPERFRAELQSLLPLMQGINFRRQSTAARADDRREFAYAIICDPPQHSALARACVSVASPNAPALLAQTAVPGFSEQRSSGAESDTLWHIYTSRDDVRGFTVRVAERDDIRRRIITNIVLRQSGVSLVLIPLAGILVWFVIGQGLRPLRALSGQINARRGDLLEPVTAQAPEEVDALVEALNRLFDRLTHAFDRERRFSADVAHELRTPLSVIRTTAEVNASRSTVDREREAWHAVIRQAERASRTLDQLLALARMDRNRIGEGRERISLAALAREVMADLAPQADSRHVELVLEADSESIRAYAEPVSLAILLRNLLDNAIRHAPAGSEVRVAMEARAESIHLSVSDCGPGLTHEQRARLLALLQSGEGVGTAAAPGRDQSGYGLGLRIVQRIAALHEATVDLQAPGSGRGLQVLVKLPA
jgi:two-component system sensor histidine kinase QseC